jgi:hypothetical protein
MKRSDAAGRVVEIRVHGVHGTPPGEVLGDRDPRPVGGDGSALFLRRRSLVHTGRIGERVVEAFHWGQMTAGSASTALWLVLAPFGLLNLSRYTLLMDPNATRDVERGRVARRTADAALRILGLALTLLLVTAVAFAALDVLAWQCGGIAACTKNSGWLPFAADGGSPYGLRLLVALAAPVALIALMWLFGRQVHLYQPTMPAPAQPAGTPPEQPPPKSVQHWSSAVGDFGDTRFWYGSVHAPVLRVAHTGAAMALLAMLLGYSTLRAPGLDLPTWVRWSLVGLEAAAGAGLVYTVGLVVLGWSPRHPQPDPFGRDPLKLPPWAVVFPRTATGIVLAATVAVAAVGAWQPVRDRHGNLPGFEFTFSAIYVCAAVLLLLLLVAALVLAGRNLDRKTPLRYRPLWRGAAAPVLALASVLLATGFTAGVSIQVARLVGRPAPPSFSCTTATCTKPPIQMPEINRVTAAGWGAIAAIVAVLVIAGLAIAAARGIGRWIGRNAGWRGATRQGPPTDEYRVAINAAYESIDQRLLTKIARVWRVASWKFFAPYAVLALGVCGAFLVLAQAVVTGSQLTAWAAETLSGRGYQPTLHWTDKVILPELVDAGSWVVTGIIAALLFLGMRAFRTPTWRRSVGILWDLLAFWPRLAHPIVPPPYGGRAVLALAERTRYLLHDAKARTVVLSGHSQGSLITAATVWFLGHNQQAYLDNLEQLRVITYGSQLQWAYPRLFPTYIGYTRLREINTLVKTGWYNLHRWTDPLGGPVLAYLDKPPRRRYSGQYPAGNWKTIDGCPVSPAAPLDVGDDKAVRIFPLGDQEYVLRDPMWTHPPADHASAIILGHGGYYEDAGYGYLIDKLVAGTSPDPKGLVPDPRQQPPSAAAPAGPPTDETRATPEDA